MEDRYREDWEDRVTAHVSSHLAVPMRRVGCIHRADLWKRPGRFYAKLTLEPIDTVFLPRLWQWRERLAKVPGMQRLLWKAPTGQNGRQVSVFAKRGMARIAPLVEGLIARNTNPHLRVPAYMGHFEEGAARTGVWEWLDGRHLRFREPSHAFAVARAAAVIQALTPQVRREVQGIPGKSYWLRPVAGRLSDLLKEAAWGELLSNNDKETLTRLGEAEERLLQKLSSGPQLLTHDDLSPVNVMAPRDGGPVAVVDWDILSYSTPGTSLRQIAILPEPLRRLVAHTYAETLFGLGYKVDPSDVLFAIQAHQMFAMLDLATKSRERQHLDAGLRFAVSLCGGNLAFSNKG